MAKARKIGIGSTMPKGEARPLGTPNPRGRKHKVPVFGRAVRQTKPLDNDTPAIVESDESEIGTVAIPLPTKSEGVRNMGPFKYVRTSKYGNVIYRREGSDGSVQISKSLFGSQSENPPAEISNLDEVLTGTRGAGGGGRGAMTPEKIAKIEANVAKTEARLEKQRARLSKAHAAAVPTETVNA